MISKNINFHVPPLSMEECLFFISINITEKELSIALERICNRINYIISYCMTEEFAVSNLPRWYFGDSQYLSMEDDQITKGDYFSALTDDVIYIFGDFEIDRPSMEYNIGCDTIYSIPRRWLWENFEDEFNAMPEVEERAKLDEEKRLKLLAQRKKEVMEKIRKYLTEEEIKILKTELLNKNVII